MLGEHKLPVILHITLDSITDGVGYGFPLSFPHTTTKITILTIFNTKFLAMSNIVPNFAP